MKLPVWEPSEAAVERVEREMERDERKEKIREIYGKDRKFNVVVRVDERSLRFFLYSHLRTGKEEFLCPLTDILAASDLRPHFELDRTVIVARALQKAMTEAIKEALREEEIVRELQTELHISELEARRLLRGEG